MIVRKKSQHHSLVDLFNNQKIFLLVGESGSGKSTQLKEYINSFPINKFKIIFSISNLFLNDLLDKGANIINFENSGFPIQSDKLNIINLRSNKYKLDRFFQCLNMEWVKDLNPELIIDDTLAYFESDQELISYIEHLPIKKIITLHKINTGFQNLNRIAQIIKIERENQND